MKLCLTAPPTRHMIRTNVPDVVDEVTGCYPPLGLLYVAAAVEESSRHEVCVIDCVAEGLTDEQLASHLLAYQPDVVGIQAMTFTLIDAFNTARLVKRILPEVPVLMGGPHVNLYPEETLCSGCVDYVLLGEGERVIVPFLDAIAAGREPNDVPGAVYRDRNGVIHRGPPNPLIEDLDSLPIPARHLLDNRRYRSVLGRGRYLTTIMSSRGCPARCIFCDRPHLGKKFRARSAESVVKEMRQCHEKLGIDEFFFYDDTFTINRARVLDICRAIRAAGLEVFWDIRARISNVDPEILKALYEAGCRRIHFGIESGNEKILKVIRKGVDLERARAIFRECRRIGIETLAYFMLGFPEEGPEEIRDTIRYALTLDCDYVHVAVTTPFPGTELYRLGLEKGLYKNDYWAAFARNPTEDFVPELWTENFTREELIDYMFLLYRRFYRRPGYILRRLFKVRSAAELGVKARAGIKLLCRSSRRGVCSRTPS